MPEMKKKGSNYGIVMLQASGAGWNRRKFQKRSFQEENNGIPEVFECVWRKCRLIIGHWGPN